MYKKVLYNIKKIKNVGGGKGGGAIFEPKTLSMYLKKKKKKKSKNKNKLELMFMKHYAPNRCLYIKVSN